MKVRIKELEPEDVMCVGGQIGEFVRLSRTEVVYRPYGCKSTRGGTPKNTSYGELYPVVRVERDKQWVEVVVR